MFFRKFIRPVVLKLTPLKAHTFALRLLEFLKRFAISRFVLKLLYKRTFRTLQTEVFGIKFPNPIGLASGLDRNARFADVLHELGFGFIEVGTITPEPENDPEMANKGLLTAVENLKNRKDHSIVAANISANISAPDGEITRQLVKSFSLIYDLVDILVINTTHTSELRRSSMEDPEILSDVMDEILDMRVSMDIYKPILIKLSPDIPHEQVNSILSYSMRSGIDGIVAGDVNQAEAEKQFSKNLEFVRYIHSFTQGRLEIIGRGGIMSPEDAQNMLDAGASLIELYTGIFYEGPTLIRKTLKYLDNNKVRND